jgi:Ca2+-transporting ATPase
MVALQVLIVFEGGTAFPAVPLTGTQWAISLVLGLITLPLGVILRLLPDGPFEWFGQVIQRLPKLPKLRRSKSSGVDSSS